jgi:hypothetical protein
MPNRQCAGGDVTADLFIAVLDKVKETRYGSNLDARLACA